MRVSRWGWLVMGWTGVYWVDRHDWSCSCPDYQFRRQLRGELCKHGAAILARESEED